MTKKRRKKIDKRQAGYLLFNKEPIKLPMDQSFKAKLQALLLRIKGEDNYLTSITIFTGVIAFMLILTAIILVFLPSSTKKNLSRNFANLTGKGPTIVPATPIPTPTPRPIAKGPQTYSVSTANNPQMIQLWVNEFDPKKEQVQIFKAKIKNTKKIAISSVELKLTTDHKSKTYPLKLTSGTLQEGEWIVSLTTEDSHDYVYSAFFTMKDEKGNSSQLDLNFR